MTIQELETQVAQNGLNLEELLEFFKLLPTSDVNATRAMLFEWIDGLTQAGIVVNPEFLTRVDHDLLKHGRLTAEFIMGAPHPEYKSLNPAHNEETHFAN